MTEATSAYLNRPLRTLGQAKADLGAKGMMTPTMSLTEYARIIVESNPDFDFHEYQKRALEQFEKGGPMKIARHRSYWT